VAGPLPSACQRRVRSKPRRESESMDYCAESAVAIVLTAHGFIFKPEPSGDNSLIIVSDGQRPVRLRD